MLKVFILFTTFFLLSGCQLFSKEAAQPTSDETSQETSLEETSQKSLEESSQMQSTQELSQTSSANTEYENVFGEQIIGQNRYPETAIDDNISIAELRAAIDEYFQEIVPPEEKNNNLQEISQDDLNILQSSLTNNQQLKDLQATVDQVIISLNNQDQYVARLVVPMTYEEAQGIKENNDILLLNEAHAHIGNRLVMVAYLNSQGNQLIPYHLNTSTYSLFSQGQ